MGSTVSDTGFETRKKSYDLLVDKVGMGKSLTASELTAMSKFEEELKQSGRDLPDSFATPAEVADYSGYKSRTIYNAVKQGKLTRLSDGSFLRADVDTYLASKGRLPQVKPDVEEIEDAKPVSGSTAFEERRYRKARADREELIVARLQGELVAYDEVVRQFTNRAHEYKTSLLLLSRRCAHKIAAVAGVESRIISEILDEEAKLVLKSLSRKVELHDD